MTSCFNTEYDSVERIWSGGKVSRLYDFDCSIGQIIYKSLRNYPRNVCQTCLVDGKAATNQEILSWSVRLALKFKQQGLDHNDVICISAKNSTYVTAAAVACFFNATPFHAVNPMIDSIANVLGLTKPKVIFCDAADYEKLRDASSAWKPEFITVTGKVQGIAYVEDLLMPTKAEFFYTLQQLVLGGNQTVLIICSSGTTGLPKAVCVANHMMLVDTPLVNSEMVGYCESGLHWMTGIANLLYSVVLGCNRIISEKPFSAEHFLDLTDKYQISGATFSPFQATTLAKCPETTHERLASVCAVGVGGGWVPTSTLDKLQSCLGKGYVIFGYGTTETGRVSGGIYNKKLGNTAGKLVAGVQLRLVDEHGQNLEHNEVGEVLVFHGRKWSGYYGNPEETEKMQDPEGWFHTGDLGYFDAENNLYIVDRKKDICKCLGMQYSTHEIEEVILQLHDIQAVCVVGLYDDYYGDASAAMVVKRPGSSLSEEEIKEHVAQQLTVEYKQLHGGVYFVDDLPVNANGKVLSRQVRDQLTKISLDR